jgi:hypothetical protein
MNHQGHEEHQDRRIFVFLVSFVVSRIVNLGRRGPSLARRAVDADQPAAEITVRCDSSMNTAHLAQGVCGDRAYDEARCPLLVLTSPLAYAPRNDPGLPFSPTREIAMRRFSIVLTTIVLGLARPLPAQTVAHNSLVAPSTAWKAGYPAKCLKNARDLTASFKAKARNLGRDGKLRVLIIGDSLSDGEYHWSHYFRRDLQAAYGDGGPGAIWAAFAGGSAGQGFAPGWLWSPKDFTSYKGSKGAWRTAWGGRGDIWPYLGWNGTFLATDSPDSRYFLDAVGSQFTVVYSSGTFTTFDGRSLENRAAGFTEVHFSFCRFRRGFWVVWDDGRKSIPAVCGGVC